MNKKAIVALLSSTLLIGGVLVSQVGNGGGNIFSNIIKDRFGATAPTTINLNSSSLIESDFGSGSFSKDIKGNGYGSFTFTGASYVSGKACALAEGGTIVKDDASKGLTSVEAVFTGSLTLYCSDNGTDFTMKYELTSGESVVPSGNYIKFVAGEGGAVIDSINIRFNCYTETQHNHVYNNKKWDYDENNHWRQCSDKHCTVLKDSGAHTISEYAAEVKPTYYNPGHTVGRACSVCGMGDGAVEIPILNTDDYSHDVVFNATPRTFTETWVLNDPSTIGKDYYSVETVYQYGCVTVHDFSSGEEVETDYTPYDFNEAFDGLELTIDMNTATATLNVTKEGGYTFNDICLTFPSAAIANKLVITGYPLTIKSAENVSDDALSMWSKGTSGTATNLLIVQNDLTIIYDHAKPSNNGGLNVFMLTVESNASLKISGFKRGLTVSHNQNLNVNGIIDVSGADGAFYGTSSINSRTIRVSSDKDIYADHEYKQTGGSISFKQNTGYGAYKHVTIIPTGHSINEFISFDNQITKKPTYSETGTFGNGVCSSCGHSYGDVTLPVLSAANYDITGGLEQIGGKWYDTATYTWKNHSYGTIEISNKDVELSRYIKVGDTVHSVRTWNDTYTGSVASESGNNLTITLNGDVELTDTLDLTKYDEVTINGTGSLSITTQQKTAILAKKLVIANGLNVTLNGTTKSTSNSNRASFVGVNTTDSLEISGTLIINNFCSGIYGAVETEITSTGHVEISNVLYGACMRVNNSTFENYGYLNINVSGGTPYALYCDATSNTNYIFGGDSRSYLTSTKAVITQANTQKFNVRICDNAYFEASSTGAQTIYGVSEFVVGNGEDGSGKCNAEVKLSSSNNDCLYFVSQKSFTQKLIINSEKAVSITKIGSVERSGILIQNGKFDVKIASELIIKHFAYCFYFNNSERSFNSAVCTYPISHPECGNLYGGTTPRPDGDNFSSWFAANA